MGASFSTQLSESNMELRKRIDAAATKVILDSSFKDLLKLANETNCNRLVKKVASVFQQNRDTVDLELLRQKLYDKREEREDREKLDDDNDDDGSEKTPSDKHNNKIKIKKTPKIQNVEKKCIQISKFYVLFAHLFSCIVSTINPSFKIESSSDKKEKTSTSTSTSTPTSDSSEEVDFCSKRIIGLVDKSEQNSDGEFRVNPDVCETNVSKSGKVLRLIDLPGMKQLKELYNDGSNDDSEKNDAQYFFKAFTGNNPPDDIRHLEQVPLKRYNMDKECEKQKSYSGGRSKEEEEEEEHQKMRRRKERRFLEKEEQERERDQERMFYTYDQRRDRKRDEKEDARTGIYLKGVVGSLKERLFSEYVQHIKEMIERAEYNRSKLLEILSEMFTYQYDGDGNINGVIINPSLTYKKLQALVVQTRRHVIKLYTDCEEDYKNGLDIFFAIVQEKIVLTLSVQEDVLKQQLEGVMYGPQERYIPESLLYSQQFPGAQEFNKKQFVPPHFKSSVVSIVQKELRNNTAFQSILPSLNEWINEEIENATGLLDPTQVADEFLKENVYGDDEYSSSASMMDDDSGSSSALVAPSAVTSSAVTSLAVVAPSTPFSAPSYPSVVAATPLSKTKTYASTASKSFPSGPSVSQSPRKVRRGVDINPKKLTSLFEDQVED